MLDGLNSIRDGLRKPRYILSEELTERAQSHAEYLARTGVLIHSRLKPGEAENIALGTKSQALSGWWRSRGHRANITWNYSYVGIGKADRMGKTYWVVIFGN